MSGHGKSSVLSRRKEISGTTIRFLTSWLRSLPLTRMQKLWGQCLHKRIHDASTAEGYLLLSGDLDIGP
jgi:hypothetical protein